MCTVGRTDEIPHLLRSLDSQSIRDFELIVVDQNEDDRVSAILEPFRDRMVIKHIWSDKGLSRARNAAYPHIEGEIVGFPDDDCTYPPKTLETIAYYFDRYTGMDLFIGRKVDPAKRVPDITGDAPVPVLADEVWTSEVCSSTFWIRRKALMRVGKFDETLGIGSGSPWQSSEDIDIPWRAARAGCVLLRQGDVHVYHPVYEISDFSTEEERSAYRARVAKYAPGVGRVWRKNGFPLYLAALYLIRPLGGAVLNLLRGRFYVASVQFASFKGRLQGWLSR